MFDLCKAYFNVEQPGNVDPRGDPHGELKGQNVLTIIETDPKQILKDFGLESEAELASKIGQIQKILHEARQGRPRPHLDDKILTSWNGLMISGFAIAGMALQGWPYISAR